MTYKRDYIEIFKKCFKTLEGFFKYFYIIPKLYNNYLNKI